MAEALMDSAAAATMSPSRASSGPSGLGERPRSAPTHGGDAETTGTVDFAASSRNIRMMRVLARLAKRFNDAGVPIMALKGAALNLTLYTRPDERPMADIDLLIKPQDAERAARLFEELGCLRGEPLVREDFFPRYYYEMDYTSGSIFKV